MTQNLKQYLVVDTPAEKPVDSLEPIGLFKEDGNPFTTSSDTAGGGSNPAGSSAQGSGYLGWSFDPIDGYVVANPGYGPFSQSIMHAVRVPIVADGRVDKIRYHLTQPVGPSDWQAIYLFNSDGAKLAQYTRDTHAGLLSGSLGIRELDMNDGEFSGGPGLDVVSGDGVWVGFCAGNVGGFGLGRKEPTAEATQHLNRLLPNQSTVVGPKFGRAGTTDHNVVDDVGATMPQLVTGYGNDFIPYVSLLSVAA